MVIETEFTSIEARLVLNLLRSSARMFGACVYPVIIMPYSDGAGGFQLVYAKTQKTL